MALIDSLLQIPKVQGPSTKWTVHAVEKGEYPGRSTESLSGVTVGDSIAFKTSSFHRGTCILAGTIAAMPLQIFRRVGDSGRELAVDHPMYRLLKVRPHRYLSAFNFWFACIVSVIFRGNFYSFRNRSLADGRPLSFIPLNPDRVTTRILDGIEPRYDLNPDAESGPRKNLTREEIFHVAGPSGDGIRGRSILQDARDAIGMGRAAEEFASRTYTNQATHAGALQHPRKLSPDAHARLESSLEKFTGLANAKKAMILEEGMTWQSISMSPEDVELLASRRFTIADISRFLGVPLHLLNETEKVTSWGTGLEQFNQGFFVYSLNWWLTNIEQAVDSQLLDDGIEFFSEFNTKVLLRGDRLARAKANEIERRNGALSPNEWRADEGRNPYDGGEEFQIMGAPKEEQDEDQGEDDDE